jgi:hypothetical protein
MSFINLCLSIPNLDTIIFYLIFVIAIPGFLFINSDYETLKYYLPGLVMLAVTLTEAGTPNMFTNLYPIDPSNMSGFLSVNIINGMALVGLLAQAILVSLATGNLTLGLVSGVITFAITFPLAQQVLPYFIREVEDLRIVLFGNRVSFPSNWHKYMAGFLFAMFLLGIQYILLIGITKYILTTGRELI